MVERESCPCKGPKLSSQYPGQAVHNPLSTPSQSSEIPVSGLCGHPLLMYTPKPIHMFKISKILKRRKYWSLDTQLSG